MTPSERGDFDQHWTSERFHKDLDNLCLLDHFYEDGDPRIELVTDIYGEECWIVGYVEAIPLTVQFKGGMTEIPRKLLVIKVKDNALYSVDTRVIDRDE